MPQRIPTREEIQSVLLALLVARKESSTCGVAIAALERDYRDEEGMRIPFRELGHSCLLDLLRSMSSVLSVRQRNGLNVVYPIVSEKTAHVSSLVAGQKVSHKKPRGGRRPVMRRTPWYPQVSCPPRRLDSKILGDIAGMARNRRDGMPMNEVLRYIQNRSNASFELEDLKVQLREINHEVVVERDVVYSVSSYQEPTSITQNGTYAKNSYTTNNNCDETTEKYCEVRCSGHSDEEEDFGPMRGNAVSSIGNANDNSNNDNYRTKIAEGEPNERKNVDKGEVFHEENNNCEVDEDDENCDQKNTCMLINERTKFRLEKLIQQHPEGICCADLPDIYLKEYKLSLNYEELGFGSVSDFAAYLPDVFHAVQPEDKGDFKLFDAKAERPNLKPIERPNTQTLAALHKIYEAYGEEKELPVPTVLPNGTSQRLIPDGVMSFGETVPQISVTELNVGGKEYIDVVVVELYTPSFFWIQLLNRTPKFEQFMIDLHSFYSIHAKEYAMPIIIMEKGLNCACRYDDRWHRGLIKTVKHDNTVTVLFYDYGTVQTYEPEEIHFLHRSFSASPAQAIPCGLYNVKPKDSDKWSKLAALQLSLQVIGKPLVATIAVTDTDNNSMLIGLTNTEASEDLHINDWMVQNGFATYGKMVCIRPPNYPFQRFLECEYKVVNRMRAESSGKLSKIVELTEPNDALESPPASRNTMKNLEWYKIFLELRRSSISGKKQSEISDIVISKARREDPEIFNEIKSQTGKNSTASRDVKKNENGTGLVDIDTSSKFGTDFLIKMCKDQENRNTSMYKRNECEKSIGNKKSVASSSSASIVAEEKIRDQRISNAEITITDNCCCVQYKSSIGSSPKSELSSSSDIPKGFGNEIGTLPLHLKDPPIEEKNTEISEFGTFRSIHGGHGRMELIDWNKIRGNETIEKINEMLKKQKSEQLRSNEVYNSKANNRPACDTFCKQSDSRFSKIDTNRDNVFNGLHEVSTTSSSTSRFSSYKRIPWKTVEKSNNNYPEDGKIRGESDGTSLTINRSNNHSAVHKAAGEVDQVKSSNFVEKNEEKSLVTNENNEISTTFSSPKLPESKIKSSNIVEKTKEKSLVTNENPEVSTTFSTPKFPASKLKIWNNVEKSKEKSLVTTANNEVSTPKFPASKLKIWNNVEKSKEKSLVTTTNNEISTTLSVPKLPESKESPTVHEANEAMTSPTGKISVSESTSWNDIERSKEDALDVGDFHSPLGGRGRMEPCEWRDVFSPEKNVPQSSQIQSEVTENVAKTEIELWKNLPNAKKGFVNIVNSVLPKGCPRDAIFKREGIIRMTNDVSVTVRRALKRLREDRSEKRVRLMIPDDVLELLRDNDDETDSISSFDATKKREKPQNTTAESQDISQSSFDAIVRDSETSISPKESSKLNDPSLSIESTLSTDKDIPDFQTPSDNPLNSTPEILQQKTNNFDESTHNSELSVSTKIEAPILCIESAVAKPNARLLNELSKLLAAPQDTDTVNDTALDSDDLCSDDDENETRRMSTESSEKEDVEDAENRTENSRSERCNFENPTVTQNFDLTTKKLEAINEFAVSKDESNESAKAIDEIGKSVVEEKFVETEASETPSTCNDVSPLQVTKKFQTIVPIFNDIDIGEEDDDEWDFSPHCIIPAAIPEFRTQGEDFEDIDVDESFKEDESRVENLDIGSAKEESICDENRSGNSDEEKLLLESLENSSANEVSDCDEISFENSEEERPLLESLKDNSSIDGTTCDESILEISHTELKAVESESSRQETTESNTRSLEKNNFSTDDEFGKRNDKVIDNRENDSSNRNQNIALSNISKLRDSSRLVDDFIGKKNSADDSDERFNSNDKLSTRETAACSKDIEKIGSLYSILSEVKKAKISADAKAFIMELDDGSASETSSGNSFRSLINAFKNICS